VTESTFDMEALRTLTPEDFAALVKSASKSQLDDLMAGEHRKEILDTIFEQLPSRFRPDRAGNTDAVIHWNITSSAGADSYAVVISGGTCTSGPASETDPKLVLTLSAADFLGLIAGTANPTMMFMTGKLKVKGDPMLAASIANLFDFPKG
jgi:putative sterol carrier protein